MKDELIILCPNILKAQDTITSIVEDGAYASTVNHISINLVNGTSFTFVPEGDAKAFAIKGAKSTAYYICSFERFKEILNKSRKDHERSDTNGI